MVNIRILGSQRTEGMVFQFTVKSAESTQGARQQIEFQPYDRIEKSFCRRIGSHGKLGRNFNEYGTEIRIDVRRQSNKPCVP
ncbi:hypothetical protein SDC9_56573 [bioreactor metagenome]|uniref:Uncharacterized protein n=1 Tax=bioreactor metagenome TaxID=1076179 RepID=A0A644X259_9ZZZZ